MFDFEKLNVYQKAKKFNKGILELVSETKKMDRITQDQLRRASLSIMLNIAEGSGRFSNADRSNFFVISRGSLYECVAVLDNLCEQSQIDKESYERFYSEAEELSKMLFAMIKNLKHT
ncbi:MAG: four helix bundle protein [Bacteroidales bacterium]